MSQRLQRVITFTQPTSLGSTPRTLSRWSGYGESPARNQTTYASCSFDREIGNIKDRDTVTDSTLSISPSVRCTNGQ